MSVITLAPGEMDSRVNTAKAMLSYFKRHKERLLPCTNLTMHPELFAYGDKEQLTAFLRKVGGKIYNDIDLEPNIFAVGNLGSIWYDREYTSCDGAKHLVRIGLIGNFDPSVIDLQKNEDFDERAKFFFNVDILDLM